MLDLQGYNLTVGSLGGGGGTLLSNSAGSTPTLTVNMPSGTTTYSGVLANGSGTLALTIDRCRHAPVGRSQYVQRRDDDQRRHAEPGQSGRLGRRRQITFGGGTLQFTAGNTPDCSGSIANSTSAIAIDTNSQSVTFAGNLSGSNSGGLTKIAAGALTLSATGANYTGPTVVSGGTLAVTGGGTLRRRRPPATWRSVGMEPKLP